MDKKTRVHKLIDMSEKTRVHKANSKSVSLRTTVPRRVAALLHLEEGDYLHWDIAFFPTGVNLSNIPGVYMSSPVPLMGIVAFVQCHKLKGDLISTKNNSNKSI